MITLLPDIHRCVRQNRQVKLALLLVAALSVGLTGSPYMMEIKYEVDGTIHYANLTQKNKDGATEQKQEKLPYELTFYAQPGATLYLSAQKARITKSEDGMITTRTTVVDDGVEGSVHVLIRAGGKVLQEATATAPYGIATASGLVPD
jgi:hypothetical protein